MKSGFDFWDFMRHTAVPAIYWAQYYNGENTMRRDRQFMEDMYSFRVGSARLRQNRVVPGMFVEVSCIQIYRDIFSQSLNRTMHFDF